MKSNFTKKKGYLVALSALLLESVLIHGAFHLKPIIQSSSSGVIYSSPPQLVAQHLCYNAHNQRFLGRHSEVRRTKGFQPACPGGKFYAFGLFPMRIYDCFRLHSSKGQFKKKMGKKKNKKVPRQRPSWQSEAEGSIDLKHCWQRHWIHSTLEIKFYAEGIHLQSKRKCFLHLLMAKRERQNVSRYSTYLKKAVANKNVMLWAWTSPPGL